jgi:hypothetical protein
MDPHVWDIFFQVLKTQTTAADYKIDKNTTYTGPTSFEIFSRSSDTNHGNLLFCACR